MQRNPGPWAFAVLIAALMFNCGATFAEDLSSANYMMRGCRSFLKEYLSGTLNDAVEAGICAGAVDGLAYRRSDVCTPRSATTG